MEKLKVHDTAVQLSYNELREALKPPSSDYMKIAKPQQIQAYLVVAQYSDKYNRFISSSLLKKLWQMPADMYLTFIQQNLMADQRDELMRDERLRLKTFSVNCWPYQDSNSTLSGEKMAQAGLYYLNEADKVQCVFCKGCLFDWKEGDNVMMEHGKLFSFCRFVKGFECGNRPYVAQQKKLAKEALSKSDITIYPHASNQQLETSGEYFGIMSDHRVGDIRKANYDSRLLTFQKWPGNGSIAAERMCEAGFVYGGHNDGVRCFSCRGHLESWNNSDDPWVEHARWFPHCAFLAESRGETFINEVHSTTPRHLKCPYKPFNAGTTNTSLQGSMHNEMVETCLKLEYSQLVIDQAIAFNGQSFNDIKAMIDVIHAIEDGEITVELAEVVPKEQEASNSSQSPPKIDGSCRMCDQGELASNIGLSCGHLIFCDACSASAKERADKAEAIMCPYPQCNLPLLGTKKIYFA